jgi:hypothetical protein
VSHNRHALGAVVLLLAGTLAGCGGGVKAKVVTPVASPRPVPRKGVEPPPVRTDVRLVVLPADWDKFPKLAAAMSAALADAKVAGVDNTVVTRASLEVVQISIECIDPSPECWGEAGRKLDANRVLFARLGAPIKKGVSATVTLFDVDAGAEIRSASRTWPSEAVALADVGGLVAEVTGTP